MGSLHNDRVLKVTDFHHVRVNSSELLTGEDHSHITKNIETFWSKAKHQLSRFNGIPREHFGLFLKECEWRFNNPNSKDQLALLEQLVNDQMGLVSKDSLEKKMSPRCSGSWDFC